ncbi:MAG: nucleotidyl transferase AbiEii/AbiGii toxin family protein [Bdellovibrionaceae bacterium]|nr:nucleotidyl transferase AbiEii/AbiGii toxin family protein [Pseudobdellovibrionaceae bacterium]
MTTKAKGTSIRQKIIDLGKKLGVEPRDLETVFMIERLVARLIADKKLASNLVFKGGFVGLKVYESPRYTVDLDALLVKSNVDETLERVKQQAEIDLNDGVWFRFESQVDLATQGEYGGIRHSYRAGIGEVLKNIKKAQVIHFDLGIGDPITPGPQKEQTPSLLGGNEEISWSVYPIETICAEKLHALISHGDENSRSKDVHDLAIFLPKVDGSTMKEALKRSFEFRSTELPTSFYAEIKKLNTARLERGWASAVDSIPNAMSFRTAFDQMLKLIGKLEAK